jgi:hypothetical protein
MNMIFLSSVAQEALTKDAIKSSIRDEWESLAKRAGAYIALRGFVRKNDRAGRWALKIGKAQNDLGMMGRADNQGISLLWGIPSYAHANSIESDFKKLAREIFGHSPISHTFSGHTETFGDFVSPVHAYAAATRLVNLWVPELTHNDIFTPIDFWARPS